MPEQSAANEGTVAVASAARRMRRWSRVWRQFVCNPVGVAGLAIVAGFVLIATVGPLVWSYDPVRVSDDLLSPPTLQHPFGTDNVGRDILALIIAGAKVSLTVGFFAAVGSFLLGGLVGSIAGYVGGRVDAVLMRVAEFFQVMPAFLLALVLVAMIGTKLWLVVFAITISIWPQTARLMRAQFLSLREREFVLSARALGFSHPEIVGREILPAALPPVIVQGSLDIGHAILIQAGLAFLGLGDPNVEGWGEMLEKAQIYLSSAWWMSVFPGLAIFLVVLAFNLMGDSLNEALDPESGR